MVNSVPGIYWTIPLPKVKRNGPVRARSSEDRALASGARGRRFDSCRARQTVSGVAGEMALKILIVDDNEASAQTMGWMMEMFGHEIRTAHSAEQAMDRVKDFRPAVIFLDIGLPGMNGYDLCRALKAMPETKNATLIAQTGWAEEENYRLSKEAGFDHHLVKPVDIKTLQNILPLLEN